MTTSAVRLDCRLGVKTRRESGKLRTLGPALMFSFPPLIVVPLSSQDLTGLYPKKQEVDGVRKEKERLTAAVVSFFLWQRGTTVSRLHNLICDTLTS